MLVVDDYEDSAEVIGYHAEIRGHIVRIAHDARSALEIATEFHPEVAVVDLILGADTGYELARRLQRLPGLERCRMIALSGLPKEYVVAEARRTGIEFQCQLTKPFDGPVLIEAIEGDD